jgi:hypothetical protein
MELTLIIVILVSLHCIYKTRNVLKNAYLNIIKILVANAVYHVTLIVKLVMDHKKINVFSVPKVTLLNQKIKDYVLSTVHMDSTKTQKEESVFLVTKPVQLVTELPKLIA